MCVCVRERERERDFLLMVSSGAEGSTDESTAKLETALAVSSMDPSMSKKCMSVRDWEVSKLKIPRITGKFRRRGKQRAWRRGQRRRRRENRCVEM